MPDIPKPQGDVLRRNPERECGTPIGQVSVKVRGLPDFQTISFYCNMPRLHTDECRFEGKDISVRKQRSEFIVYGTITGRVARG